MTCSFCAKWVATTREQYKRRLEVQRSYPATAVHPCPTCQSSEWQAVAPEGVDPFEVLRELDREHETRMRVEEKRAKGWWFMFWRRKRS